MGPRAAPAATLLVLLLASSTARGQAFSYQVKSEVAQGEKPILRIRAENDLLELRIELRSDDGKRYSLGRKSLARGKTATFEVGAGIARSMTFAGIIRGRVQGGGGFEQPIKFSTTVRGAISVQYDWDHLDLDGRVLQFKPSAPIERAQLSVYGEDGSQIGEGNRTFSGKTANAWLSIPWKQSSDARVMKMRLRVAAGAAKTTVELIPWSVTIDHEDVHFATGSSVIEASERPKLDDSLDKIRAITARSGKFMKMKLYVAGHTDTVGRSSMNRQLSRDRARSIARYFRGKGLRIPIAFAGFGEDVPRVKTPDNTDSPANRRADYVLGPADGAPPFSGAYTRAKASWKSLR